MLKLLIDKNQIRKSLEQYGYVWGRDASSILDLYLGEGMSGVWNSKTEIHLDSKNYSKDFLIPKKGRYDNKGADIESLFYIPAQRILSVADGRPKTFMEFDSNTPYVLAKSPYLLLVIDSKKFYENLLMIVYFTMEK